MNDGLRAGFYALIGFIQQAFKKSFRLRIIRKISIIRDAHVKLSFRPLVQQSYRLQIVKIQIWGGVWFWNYANSYSFLDEAASCLVISNFDFDIERT